MWGAPVCAEKRAGLGTRTETAAAFTADVSRSPGAARAAAELPEAAQAFVIDAGGRRMTDASN